MTILLDDVQFKTNKDFFTYMSRTFGKGDSGITSPDELVDAIEKYKGALEFYIYDTNDVSEDRTPFAEEMIKLILDCRNKDEEKISVFYRDGGEGI